VPTVTMAVIEEDNKQVFQSTAGEDVRLENLGYEQGAKAVPSGWTILTQSRAQADLWLAGYDRFQLQHCHIVSIPFLPLFMVGMHADLLDGLP
jgi:hypothetical protein